MNARVVACALLALGLMGGACVSAGTRTPQAQRGATASNLGYASVDLRHRQDPASPELVERSSQSTSAARGIPTPQPVRELSEPLAGPVPQPPLPEPRRHAQPVGER